MLHLLLKFQLLASPLPSLAAFGVLDFVHTPAPGSQAGRSCFERLSKAMLSCLLPALCLEHTLIFLLSNGSSSSMQPEASLAAKCSCPLVSSGGIRTSMLSAAALQPLGVSLFFPRELGWNFHLQVSGLSWPCLSTVSLCSSGCFYLRAVWSWEERDKSILLPVTPGALSWCLSLCKPGFVRGSLLADSQLMSGFSPFSICCGWGVPSPAGTNPLLLLDVWWALPFMPDPTLALPKKGQAGAGALGPRSLWTGSVFGSPVHH